MGHGREMMRREGPQPLVEGRSVGPPGLKQAPRGCVTGCPGSPPNKKGHKCFSSHLPEGVLDGGIIKLTAGHCICDRKYISHGGPVCHCDARIEGCYETRSVMVLAPPPTPSPIPFCTLVQFRALEEGASESRQSIDFHSCLKVIDSSLSV